MSRRRVLAAAAAVAVATAAIVGGARARERAAGAGATIEVSGIIEATEVELRSETAGEVLRVGFEEGALVAAGAVVCELDGAKLAEEAGEAEARAAEARARLAVLRNGSRPEERERARARAALEEARLADAEREFRLQRELRATEATSQDALEQAENGVAAGRAALAAARSELALVLAGPRAEDVAAAEAAAEAAARRAALARLRLADAAVAAPLTATCVERFVEPGEAVPAGALVATLADLRRLYVKVYVGERDLGRVRLGARAAVLVDAYPGRAFAGTVVRLASEAEFTPRSLQTKEDRVKLVYETKVDLPNPEGALLPGMPCDVRLELAGEP